MSFDRLNMFAKKARRSSSSSEENWDEDSSSAKEEPTSIKTDNMDEQEEGEVLDSDDDEVVGLNTNQILHSELSNSSAGSADSSSTSEFDDGFDENLMGDEDDRKRLNGLSEKERETEIFKRIEQRELMRTRWEIERKLKLARRERASDYKPKSRKRKNVREKAKEVHKDIKKDDHKISDVGIQQSDGSAVSQLHTNDDIINNDDIPITSVDTVLQDKPISINQQSNSSMDYFDHKERSKERKKNVEMNRTDKRSNAMALLKAKREGRAKREEEEAKRLAEKEREEENEELESVSGGKSVVKLRASEIYSDDSGSSDWDDDTKPSGKRSRSRSTSASKYSSSESEDDEKESKSPIYISTCDELNKLRLSRFKMERFINLPIFERTVMNCFVRISIGNNGQKPVYRVAEIVGVVETAKIYSLGKTRTNRGFRLKHGMQERVFRLEFISNQDFTETEFEKWRVICTQQNVPMPTLETLERKQLEIKEALNYEYKDEDVDKIIEEKNRFRKGPTNFAMRKTCLMKERDAAMLRGDYDVAHDLGQQIEELESRASELDKKRCSSISSISYINDRNRKRNVEDAEKAIMEEARANKGLKISDPFTRRITQPRMGFKALEKTDEFVVPQPAAAPLLLNKKKFEDTAASGSKGSNSKDYSLYSLHDFDIDLEVALPSTVNMMPKPVTNANEAAPKRSLNLEDYKKKRGLI